MYNLALVTSITSAIPHFLLKWQKIEISRLYDTETNISVCHIVIFVFTPTH